MNAVASSLKRWLSQTWEPLRHNPSAYPLGYSAGLDGLRGLMTLGVLAAHLRETWVSGAFLFMDTFFLMSAYLITSLLIKTWRRHGQLQLGRFFYRRVLRLFPANYAMLLSFTVVAWLLLDDFDAHFREVIAAGLYYLNWTRAFEVPGPGFLNHSWSLSIEEQYYLIWPLVLGFLLRKFGLRLRTALLILGAALMASVWRAYLVQDGASIARLYHGTDTRADGLLLGCALGLALSLQGARDHPIVTTWAARLATPAALILLLGGFTLSVGMREMYAYGNLLFLLVSLVLVAALTFPRRTLAHDVFEAPPLVFLGRICYGLYLWHWPVYCVMRYLGMREFALLVTALPLTFGLAIASYLFIERPFLAIKDRLPEGQLKSADARP